MTGLRQVRGKGAEGSRSFSPAVPTARGANLPDDGAEFEVLHDVAQRPQFGGLVGELGVTSAGVPIQAKMKVGEAGDRYEQEADRLAPLIVRQINAPGFGEQLQDSQLEIQEDTSLKQVQALRPMLQLKGESTEGTVSPEIESAIASARGGGQLLESGLQKRFGQAMGADFSGVRVHTDAQANALNQSLYSLAFTTQQDLYFRQGAYQPRSRLGQMLLAHELAHVLQQQTGSSGIIQRTPQDAWNFLRRITEQTEDTMLKQQREGVLRVYNPGRLTSESKYRIARFMGLSKPDFIKFKEEYGADFDIQLGDKRYMKMEQTMFTRHLEYRPEGFEEGDLELFQGDTDDDLISQIEKTREQIALSLLEKQAKSKEKAAYGFDKDLADFRFMTDKKVEYIGDRVFFPEANLYETGERVPKSKGKRFYHATVGQTSKGLVTLAPSKKGILDAIANPDVARKEGHFEGTARAIQLLSTITAFVSPQTSALLRNLSQALEPDGIESLKTLLEDIHSQYSAQIDPGAW